MSPKIFSSIDSFFSNCSLDISIPTIDEFLGNTNNEIYDQFIKDAQIEALAIKALDQKKFDDAIEISNQMTYVYRKKKINEQIEKEKLRA